MAVDPIKVTDCNSREVNLQERTLISVARKEWRLNFNLWREGYISCGYIGVAEDVIDGGGNAFNGEGSTH